MENNTEVDFEVLPENDLTFQSMTDEEKAVYWSAINNLIKAASGIKEYNKKYGEVGIKNSELNNLRTQLFDAVSTISLLEEMGEAKRVRRRGDNE